MVEEVLQEWRTRLRDHKSHGCAKAQPSPVTLLSLTLSSFIPSFLLSQTFLPSNKQILGLKQTNESNISPVNHSHTHLHRHKHWCHVNRMNSGICGLLQRKMWSVSFQPIEQQQLSWGQILPVICTNGLDTAILSQIRNSSELQYEKRSTQLNKFHWRASERLKIHVLLQ